MRTGGGSIARRCCRFVAARSYLPIAVPLIKRVQQRATNSSASSQTRRKSTPRASRRSVVTTALVACLTRGPRAIEPPELFLLRGDHASVDISSVGRCDLPVSLAVQWRCSCGDVVLAAAES